MDQIIADDSDHVFNLPQVYQKPDAQTLLKALSRLKQQPRSWKLHSTASSITEGSGSSTPSGDPKQITQYLTSVVGSPLKWIRNEDLKEKVWQEASARLTERSGRTAMSAIDRCFEIPTNSLQEPIVSIVLHEPSLTADNLGLKTWAASYLLAQRLRNVDMPISFKNSSRHILELGAGTGLVGIAAAIAFHASVFLTDLPEIETNLRRNVLYNAETMARHDATAISAVLDWTSPTNLRIMSDTIIETPTSFRVIIAADCAYDKVQPKLLADTIEYWLSRHEDARLILEMPRRPFFAAELRALRSNLDAIGLCLQEEAEESGHDDWGHDTLDEDSLVHCWYSTWQWR